jgi:hypothetical protein
VLVKYERNIVWCAPQPIVDRAPTTTKYSNMAINKPTGDNARIGAVKDRSQVYNGHIDRFVKRDSDTGRFMDQKQDGTPFKGVRKEK